MSKVGVYFILLLHLSPCWANVRTSGASFQGSRLPGPTQKQVTSKFSAPIGYVNDFAGVVDELSKRRLENTLRNLKGRAGIEFKLVTVKTTEGQDIFEFSRQIARDWNIGRSTATKTLLLVVAVREKALFTQFTRAAQAELPDGILGEMRQRMQEPISAGRHSQGLINGIQYFVEALAKKMGFSVKGIDETSSAITVAAVPPAPNQPISELRPAPGTSSSDTPLRAKAEDVVILKPIATASSSDVKTSFASVDSESTTNVSAAEELTNKSEKAVELEAPRKEDPAEMDPSRAELEKPALIDNYKVGIGDVLTIEIPNAPTNQSTLYTVTEGGVIEFPLAGGSVAVAGLTTHEIQARLEAELKRRAVDEGARLSVGVRQYSSHLVTVTGLVSHQGIRGLKRETVPLYVIISEAQPRADAGRVTIMRSGSTASTLDLHDPAALNFNVQPGDVINITHRPQEFYYIGGRINRPGQKIFQPGMTLLQAILAAGGLSRATDYKIELMREGSDGRLKTISFDLRDIKSGKVPDPRIQSGDSLEIVN